VHPCPLSPVPHPSVNQSESPMASDSQHLHQCGHLFPLCCHQPRPPSPFTWTSASASEEATFCPCPSPSNESSIFLRCFLTAPAAASALASLPWPMVPCALPYFSPRLY
jgi:hypothetical protein